MGSVCHRYMCILLYVKLIWCSSFLEIYAQLEEGVGSVCHGYMCILLYMKLMWCSGVAQIYGQLEEGVESVYPWYMCILLYMTLMQCSGVAQIYAQLEEEWVSLPWVYVHSAICEFCSVVVFQRFMLDWRRGVRSVCHGYMCILLYVQLIWCSSFPEIYAQLEEGCGVRLPWVYVHSSICETYLV